MELLKQQRRWGVWTTEGSQKVPYISPFVKGKVNATETWLSYDEAQVLFDNNQDRFKGLCLHLSPLNDKDPVLCGIDIDAHRQAKNPYAEEILAEFHGTYAEKSPSGNGYHILCYVDPSRLPVGEKGQRAFSYRNSESELEFYPGNMTNRYLTFTGNPLPECSEAVTDQTDRVLALLDRHFKLSQKEKKRYDKLVDVPSRPIRELPNTNPDIQERLQLARAMAGIMGEDFRKLYDNGDISGYGNDNSRADWALVKTLAFWLDGNVEKIDEAFRDSALYRDKWDERRGSETYGSLTIKKALMLCTKFYADRLVDRNVANATPLDILEIINQEYNKSDEKDIVSVLPFMPGLGKSTAVSYKIREILRNDSHGGMIVVTDSVERMKKYLEPNDQDLKDFLQQNQDRISIMEQENLSTEKKRQSRCPVLIMTTQRYFQSSREQIQKYTEWDGGKRDLIIIDERPYVKQLRGISIADINDIDTVLRNQMSSNCNETERKWCKYQWNAFREYMNEVYDKYGVLYNAYKGKKKESKFYFFDDSRTCITDDDARFWKFVDQQKKDFVDGEVYEQLNAIRFMMSEWCIVVCNSYTGKDVIELYTLIDYTDLLSNLGAKVIILDGTADLSFEYRSEPFKLVNDPRCMRPLDRLQIVAVNVPSSRQSLKGKDLKQMAKNLHSFIWKYAKRKRAVIFTYKQNDSRDKTITLENELKKQFGDDNVGHFGAIRGHNTYRDASCLAQFGLFRFPSICYLLYTLSHNPTYMADLPDMSTQEASEWLSSLNNSPEMTEIMVNELIADIEQNMFRGCIRSSESSEKMTFLLFCNTDDNKSLLSELKKRYEPMGAKVQGIDTPDEFKANSERAQLVLEYIDSLPDGKEFTYKDIADGTKLELDVLYRMRNKKGPVRNELEKMKIDGKRGVFKKPRKYTKHVNGQPAGK